MADFGGLIGGIMKGFGAGLEQVGQVELKKQSEMDLRKQMLEMESEKRLREDEVRRERDLAYIPKTAEATAKSKLVTAPIEAEASVAGDVAKLTAENKNKLPELRATAKATEAVANLDARTKLEVDRKEAEAAADKRVQELKAEKDKGVTKLEAERTARVEKEKYEAMISAGVPKAKADALMADYTAGDPLRRKQAEDAINAEISKVKKLSESKDYLKGTAKIKVAESAGDIAEINAREANYRKREKDESGGKTTITELKTKLTVAEDRLATELGVPRAKINEATLALKKKADRGDEAAAKKLKDIQAYRDEVDKAQQNISRWKDPDSDKDNKSGSNNKRSLDSFNNK